jgi:hypothetical protein
MLSRQLMGLSALTGLLMEAVTTDAAPGATAEATPVKKPVKTEYVKVKMEDGREIEFPAKRKVLKEVETTEGQTPTVVMDFRNGKTIRFQVPPELMVQAAGHGIAQKLGDETAGEEDVDDMYLAVESLAKRLSKRNDDGSFAGQWNVPREGGSFAGTSMLIKALMELQGKTVEQVKTFLEGKSQADKLALRAHPKVKAIIDRLEAERVTKNVDTDKLLGELGAIG